MNRFGVDLQAPAFDSRLAKYLPFDCGGTMKLRPSLVFMVRLIWLMMRLSMVKGVKEAIPEREIIRTFGT